jgi:hypothetical protein
MARLAVADVAPERGRWLRERFAEKRLYRAGAIMAAIAEAGGKAGLRTVSSYLTGGPIGDEKTLAAIAQIIGSDEQTVRKGPWPLTVARLDTETVARCLEIIERLDKAVGRLDVRVAALEKKLLGEEGGRASDARS